MYSVHYPSITEYKFGRPATDTYHLYETPVISTRRILNLLIGPSRNPFIGLKNNFFWPPLRMGVQMGFKDKGDFFTPRFLFTCGWSEILAKISRGFKHHDRRLNTIYAS